MKGVAVHFRQRLANQMIQLCFGRLMAEEFFGGCPVFAAEGCIPHPVIFPLLDAPSSNLMTYHAKGYRQNAGLFVKRESLMRLWLKLHPTDQAFKAWGNATIAHIRLGDYLQNGWALPPKYYEAAFRKTGAKELWVFSDQPDHISLKCRHKVFHGDELTTILALMVCKNLIISESSFSWLPAFIGFAEKVYYPISPRYYWGKKKNVNLWIQHERRVDMIDGRDW